MRKKDIISMLKSYTEIITLDNNNYAVIPLHIHDAIIKE